MGNGLTLTPWAPHTWRHKQVYSPLFPDSPCDIRDILFPFLTLFTLLALLTARTSTVLRSVVSVSSQYSWMCPLIY